MSKLYLVRMKDQVEFADTLEELVQCLNEHLYQIKDAQFTFGRIHTEHKVERGVMSVDKTAILTRKEITKNVKNKQKTPTFHFQENCRHHHRASKQPERFP